MMVPTRMGQVPPRLQAPVSRDSRRIAGGGWQDTRALTAHAGADKLNGLGWEKPPLRGLRGRQAEQPHLDTGDVAKQLEEAAKMDQHDDVAACIEVRLEGGDVVYVEVDPSKGPRHGAWTADYVDPWRVMGIPHHTYVKPWTEMTIREKEVMIMVVAKQIRGKRVSLNRPDLCSTMLALQDNADGAEPLKSPEELAQEVGQRIAARCWHEKGKKSPRWQDISIEQVTQNAMKSAKGLFYGLEFPWNEDMLFQMGPEWLTRAFHTAGTLDHDNWVTKLIPEKKLKVTTGNNGGKFLFEVRYAKKQQHLHTHLFAKVPFPLDGVTRADRLSSSVNKQPQDFYEINTSRLLEDVLPCQVPRYYYGDVSNDTSNFILITERVRFGDPERQNYFEPQGKRRPLKPFVIEGPYDKCIDYNLRGEPKEYYTKLVVTGARMAGLYKAGKLGSEELLTTNFANMAGLPPEAFRISVGGASGEDPRMFKPKLEMAMAFITEIGFVLFPTYTADQEFQDKFKNVMFTMNAYTAEINYWKHLNADYVALTHGNLNVDNAYWWRDEEGALQIGVFDWGGLGATSLGTKLWWWLYCSDHDVFRRDVRGHIETFIQTYKESGGPSLDAEVLYKMVILSALEQMKELCKAVPQIYSMCAKARWKNILSRYDQEIAENVDGKSTLRLYLHVMNSIIRIIQEMDADKVLQAWVESSWGREMKLPLKSQGIITGESIVSTFGSM